MDENMIRESREDRLLRGVLLAYFINGWIGIFGSLLPFFRQAYGLSYDQAGLMLSFRSVGNLVSMVLWGLLALRLGRRRSILLTVLMMVGCYALLASGWGTPALLMAVCLVEGTAVSPYYDSLLGKLIVFAGTREEALRKLRASLCELVIDGIPTNLEEQLRIVEDERFTSGNYDLTFMGNG